MSRKHARLQRARAFRSEAGGADRTFSIIVVGVLLVAALIAKARGMGLSPAQEILSILAVGAIGSVIVGIALAFQRMIKP